MAKKWSKFMTKGIWAVLFLIALCVTYSFLTTVVRNSFRVSTDVSSFNMVGKRLKSEIKTSTTQSLIKHEIKKEDYNHRKSDTRNDDSSEIRMIREYHQKGLNLRKIFKCSLLFDGDIREGKKVVDFLLKHPKDKNVQLVSNQNAVKMFKHCDQFKSIREYRKTPCTEEEKKFPLAYVILIHTDFEQLERHIRALYQPQHVFCIHVDRKSPESFQQAVRAYASCFPNVHLASVQYEVTYAHVSRLLADISCMKDLSRLDHPWRYLTTTVSTEFPLRSNKEKVVIFEEYNGLNEIKESWYHRTLSRFTKVYEVVDGQVVMTDKNKTQPPHNITIVKGRASNVFSRAFVDWFHKDRMAQDLLEWSIDAYSPDEHYWGTLNDLYHNPFFKTPGGFKGEPDQKVYRSIFAIWVTTSVEGFPCYGFVRHNLCLFGSLDLPTIRTGKELTVNKLDLPHDPVAYACMEQLLEIRERNPGPLDLNLYRQALVFNKDGTKQIYKKSKVRCTLTNSSLNPSEDKLQN